MAVIQGYKRDDGGYDVAAFCSCCGAEITLKAEACAACGTPRHGMKPAERKPVGDEKDGGLQVEKPRRTL